MTDRSITMAGLPSSAIIAAIIAGCGASADPAFERAEVVAAACTDAPTCVEVRALVDGNREGEGSCALYGPGDPEDLEPLAESGDLEMLPGETTIWSVSLGSRLGIADLNAVCQPMIEG